MEGKVTTSTNNQKASAGEVNIFAAKEISRYVRSTLGPMGLDKLLVDKAGDTVVTNDGATILKRMDVTHPTARMIIEVARTQEEHCYDGTTSSIILTGELMKQAETLLSKKIHPNMIARGFKDASNKAEELLDALTIKVDSDLLTTVAETAMTGKSAESDKGILASICVEVAQATSLDNISIIKRPGGKVADSTAISGLLIDREKVHHGMPEVVENAKIALIEVDVTLPEFATQVQVRVDNNDAVEEFIAKRKAQLQTIAQNIMATGANVVFCLRDIDPLVVEQLTKNGVYAARRVAKSDIESISKATGARIISAVDDLTTSDLGEAGLLEEVSVNESPLIKLTKTPSSEAVSVLIRAPTQHVVDEIARAFDDAVGVVSVAHNDGKVLAGGGSTFMNLSKSLKEYATTIGGRAQLAVEAFANALEVIPATLAENSGLDPVDSMIELRRAHSESSDDAIYYGVNVYEGGVINMREHGVIEPLKVVSQAIQSATETAAMLVRIDDIITSKSQAQIGDDDFAY